MRAVKVNRTLYPKLGYLSDSYQFAPKSALFRLRTRQKVKRRTARTVFGARRNFFRRKKFFCDFLQNMKKTRLYPLVCLALRRISRPRKTIDHAIALSREDVPLSARFAPSSEARVSTAQTGADFKEQTTQSRLAVKMCRYPCALPQVPRRVSRPHRPIDPAIALSREEWCRFAPFGLRGGDPVY